MAEYKLKYEDDEPRSVLFVSLVLDGWRTYASSAPRSTATAAGRSSPPPRGAAHRRSARPHLAAARRRRIPRMLAELPVRHDLSHSTRRSRSAAAGDTSGRFLGAPLAARPPLAKADGAGRRRNGPDSAQPCGADVANPAGRTLDIDPADLQHREASEGLLARGGGSRKRSERTSPPPAPPMPRGGAAARRTCVRPGSMAFMDDPEAKKEESWR